MSFTRNEIYQKQVRSDGSVRVLAGGAEEPARLVSVGSSLVFATVSVLS
jgi:hypothetical protein